MKTQLLAALALGVLLVLAIAIGKTISPVVGAILLIVAFIGSLGLKFGWVAGSTAGEDDSPLGD